MLIEGISGNKAEVDKAHRVATRAISVSAIHEASLKGDAYSVLAADAGPVAAEYTIYLQNNSTAKNIVIDDIWSYGTDADVVWKLTIVTGTAAGASAISPINLNLSAGGVGADAACRGGAGGVTGLSAGDVIMQWYNGVANTTEHKDVKGSIVLANGNAIAAEYDAGTGGAALIEIHFHFVDA